ncbi:MAG: hypothetical protein Tsb0015_15270 [Simkaniaceae bacterium]
MSDVNWQEMLGFGEDELQDMRFVGYSYIRQGHYETAKLFFEALIILSDQNAYDFQTLGAIYLQLGDNLAALNYLEKALKMEPAHGPTLLNRAKALLLLGYKKQGITAAQELLAHPDTAIADQASALLMAYS